MTTEYVNTIGMDREEWLDLRHAFVNSSDVAALYGLSSYKSHYSLWHEKSEPRPDETEETANQRMVIGTLIEDAIASIALNYLGVRGEQYKFFAYNEEYKIGANFDWHVVDKESEYDGWLIECKNVDFMVYRDQWRDDQAPAHIELQVQQQLELTGRPGAIIAALVGGNDLKIILRHPDAAVGAMIREDVAKFWDSIESGVEPEPDWSVDVKRVMARHIDATKGKIFDGRKDTVLFDLAREYAALKRVEKETTKELGRLKDSILTEIGDASKALLPAGWGISAPHVKGKAGKEITQSMVGMIVGASGPYRQMTVRPGEEDE